MWTRAQLKTNAKTALKTRYGIAIVVSLIAGMLSGGSPSLGTSYFTGTFSAASNDIEKMKDFFTTNIEISSLLFSLLFLAVTSGVVFGIFVSAPIAVGQNSFYLQNRLRQGNIGTLFSGFEPGYLNVVKVVFLKNLYIFLWSLLFVIPGIIKTYEYHMVEYILAENPHIDSARALEISREMMRGHKLDTFILRLSFFGWSILSVMSCGIGFLFLMPYIQATFAELYTALREKVVAEGRVTFEELTGVRAF